MLITSSVPRLNFPLTFYNENIKLLSEKKLRKSQESLLDLLELPMWATHFRTSIDNQKKKLKMRKVSP